MATRCDCEGCRRERAGGPGYQPCERARLSPPPTVEFIGKDDPRIGGGSDAVYLIPLAIFFFSVGMAVGKYWLEVLYGN